MNATSNTAATLDIERRRRIRKGVLWLSLMAAAFYIGFIVLTIAWK